MGSKCFYVGSWFQDTTSSHVECPLSIRNLFKVLQRGWDEWFFGFSVARPRVHLKLSLQASRIELKINWISSFRFARFIFRLSSKIIPSRCITSLGTFSAQNRFAFSTCLSRLERARCELYLPLLLTCDECTISFSKVAVESTWSASLKTRSCGTSRPGFAEMQQFEASRRQDASVSSSRRGWLFN